MAASRGPSRRCGCFVPGGLDAGIGGQHCDDASVWKSERQPSRGWAGPWCPADCSGRGRSRSATIGALHPCSTYHLQPTTSPVLHLPPTTGFLALPNDTILPNDIPRPAGATGKASVAVRVAGGGSIVPSSSIRAPADPPSPPVPHRATGRGW